MLVMGVDTVKLKKINLFFGAVVLAFVGGVSWKAYDNYDREHNPFYGLTKEQKISECQDHLLEINRAEKQLSFWDADKSQPQMTSIFKQKLYHYSQVYDQYCK